jgi:hypothetical protein
VRRVAVTYVLRREVSLFGLRRSPTSQSEITFQVPKEHTRNELPDIHCKVNLKLCRERGVRLVDEAGY